MNGNNIKGKIGRINKNACFSHNSDDWETPSFIYEYFMQNGYVDPCPLLCKEDNLKRWYFEKLFINPPYSKISEWVEFIKLNIMTSGEVVLLIPARTDTKYFHELMKIEECITHLYFIKGRLQFGDSKKSAPFPSVIIKFNHSPMTALFVDFIEQEDILKI